VTRELFKDPPDTDRVSSKSFVKAQEGAFYSLDRQDSEQIDFLTSAKKSQNHKGKIGKISKFEIYRGNMDDFGKKRRRSCLEGGKKAEREQSWEAGGEESEEKGVFEISESGYRLTNRSARDERTEVIQLSILIRHLEEKLLVKDDEVRRERARARMFEMMALEHKGEFLVYRLGKLEEVWKARQQSLKKSEWLETKLEKLKAEHEASALQQEVERLQLANEALESKLANMPDYQKAKQKISLFERCLR
jgi:hypothetical protein